VKLVIAFAAGKLRPEVRAVLAEVGGILADVSASDYSYHALVKDLWNKGESFLLVEEDVLAPPTLLKKMAGCPEPWCGAYGWRFSGPVGPGETKPQHPKREKEFALFCNKFDASLLARTKGMLDRSPLKWTQLDLAILGTLAQRGAERHEHGPVKHLTQRHPEWAMNMTEDDWTRVDALVPVVQPGSYSLATVPPDPAPLTVADG
jgi:hypothetical protein